MKILAFDTCLDKMYVALGDNGDLIDSEIIENTQTHYHSAFLISTIRDILLKNNLTVDQIDAIATNIGPGSFTGIRACTTVARVFAQAKSISTIGISSLEILSKISESDKTCVLLDARKEMAYIASYEQNEETLSPQALPLAEIKEILSQSTYEIIADEKMAEVFSDFGAKSYIKINQNLGKYLIELAFQKLNQKKDFSWKSLHPLYIQPPPVSCKK